jgi:hypothetical protein
VPLSSSLRAFCVCVCVCVCFCVLLVEMVLLVSIVRVSSTNYYVEMVLLVSGEAQEREDQRLQTLETLAMYHELLRSCQARGLVEEATSYLEMVTR